jgi:hypothetical protein
MEKKWDTVFPADLKRLFVSGTYVYMAGHERVKVRLQNKSAKYVGLEEG